MPNKYRKEDRYEVERVPVFSVDGKPLSPTDPRQARLMVKRGAAIGKHVGGVYQLHMTRVVGNQVPTPRSKQTS